MDKTKINKELEELKAQLGNVAQSSSFNGQNWLYGSPQTVSMPASIKDYGDFTSVGYIEIDTGQTTLIDPGTNSNGLLTKDRNVTTAGGVAEIFYLLGSGTAGTAKAITLSASTTADELSGMVQAIDEMEQDLIDANALLGVKAKGIERQEAFTRTLIEVSKKSPRPAGGRGHGGGIDAAESPAGARTAGDPVTVDRQFPGRHDPATVQVGCLRRGWLNRCVAFRFSAFVQQ